MKQLACLLTLLVSVQTSAAQGPCEHQASRSQVAINRFERLFNIGLADGTLTLEDLEAAEKQVAPTNPALKERTTKSLDLRKGFTRILRLLKPEDWPQVIARLQNIKQRLKGEAVEVERAHAQTVFGYAWMPLQKYKGAAYATLVASTGEVIFAYQYGQTIAVSEIGSDESRIINYHPARADIVDLFEDSKGNVFLATATEFDTVIVYEARTGKKKLEMDFSKIRESTKTAIQEGHSYRPLLFESDGTRYGKKGDVVAAIVRVMPSNRDTAPAPIALVEVESKTIHKGTVPSGNLSVGRMEDGHIYAYGRSPNEGTGPRKAFIYDISTGKPIVQETILNDLGEKEIVPLLYIDEHATPRLLLYDNTVNGRIFRFDELSKTTVPIENFFVQDKPTVIKNRQGKKILADYKRADQRVELIMLPLDGSAPPRNVHIYTAEEGSSPIAIGFAHSPRGTLALVTNFNTFSLLQDRIYIYEIETGSIVDFFASYESIYFPTYSPRDGSVYIMSGPRREGEREITQIWGPLK